MLRDAGPLTSPFTENWQTMLEELPCELAASVEMAALDLLGQASGTPIARLLHPASSLKPVEERKFWSEAGPTQRSKWLKVKAAKSIRDTCSILATLRSGAHPNTSLVVDANQGWTKEDWKSHSELLLKFGPVWVEEPFPQWWTDSAVRDRTPDCNG